MRRITLRDIQQSILATKADYKRQIDELEAAYWLELDELNETEPEPEWLRELDRQINDLKRCETQVGKNAAEVNQMIQEIAFRKAYGDVINFLKKHLK